MNNIRHILSILIVVLVSISFNSCQDDNGYSYNPFQVGLATVNPIDSINGTYYLTLNNGETLYPATSGMGYKPKSKQRVFLNYTILADSSNLYTYNIRINSIRNILTKLIDKSTSQDSSWFGDDPIKVVTIGTGDNYLNIRFGIDVGGEQIKHTISLVADNSTLNNDTIELQLRHNANKDKLLYEEEDYVAFNLLPIQQKDRSSMNLKIKAVNKNNSLQEYILKYTY